MGRGGAREGAGRKKSIIQKKIRGIRLTDDEWAFVKEAVKRFRNGENDVVEAALADELPQEAASMVVYQGFSGVGLLAHLEELYQQEYGWLLEYAKYLKSDYYDKYTLDEIRVQRELIRLQIVALAPHLQNVDFSYDVKRDCSPRCVACISVTKIHDVDNDIKVKAWQEPVGLDLQEEKIRLMRTYRELEEMREKIKDLERHVNDW